MAIVFNGRAFARHLEEKLAEKVSHAGLKIIVKSFTFREDDASVLYSRLKQQAAMRIGIDYQPIELSIHDNPSTIIQKIKAASDDPTVSGVMVQKPTKTVFDDQPFWDEMVKNIDPNKDVDCLTLFNLSKVKAGEPFVLPATVRAVLSILDVAREELHIGNEQWKELAIAVVGRSDIVGKPLSWILAKRHPNTEIFGRDNMPQSLTGFDIVISATGKENLIHGGQLKDGAVVVDVGSPKGDIDFESGVDRASFITPVPGGVGPVTVISLMQNIVEMQPGL